MNKLNILVTRGIRHANFHVVKPFPETTQYKITILNNHSIGNVYEK